MTSVLTLAGLLKVGHVLVRRTGLVLVVCVLTDSVLVRRSLVLVGYARGGDVLAT